MSNSSTGRIETTGDDSSNAAGYIICIFAIRFFEIFATSQAIASRLWREEESPDSTEQCTGEEPGSDLSETDSATENNLTPQPPLHFVARGSKECKGENVG
jgi:hypothetical protein